VREAGKGGQASGYFLDREHYYLLISSRDHRYDIHLERPAIVSLLGRLVRKRLRGAFTYGKRRLVVLASRRWLVG
jgi:hypothetical protein